MKQKRAIYIVVGVLVIAWLGYAFMPVVKAHMAHQQGRRFQNDLRNTVVSRLRNADAVNVYSLNTKAWEFMKVGNCLDISNITDH